MEVPMETAQSILYETLTPLSSAPDEPPSTPPPPPSPPDSDDEDLEPYTVLRNEISPSAVNSSSLDGIDAVDYFSLNLDEDNNVFSTTLIPAKGQPSPASATPAAKEPVRTLEGNWFGANSLFRSPMLQLHKEILDFCEFLSPTPEEQATRKEAIDSVINVIKYIWPNCQAEVFGSFRTGLYLPTSDIDIVILGSDIQNPQIGLQALSRLLLHKRVGKKIQVIAKARVPIVKFVEKKSGIAFDVSFDVQNGPKAADFIKDSVCKWPPLRPLCLILKIFLQQRELNEVYTGGISSYALLAMLMAMLQNYQSGQASPEHNLGILLVNFFYIYGRKLNTADVGVSCNGEGNFFLKRMKGFSIPGKHYLISIEDPQAPENDIGKSSFNYFQVRSAFAMAFNNLTNPRAILGLGPKRSILGTIIRPDAALLERKGGSNGKVTLENLLPGAGDQHFQHREDNQKMYCNWRLDEENDESLPRSNAIPEDAGAHSSGKKRKKSKEKKIRKKAKDNEDDKTGRREKSGSRKEKHAQQHHGLLHQDGGSSIGYTSNGRVSSPWHGGLSNGYNNGLHLSCVCKYIYGNAPAGEAV